MNPNKIIILILSVFLLTIAMILRDYFLLNSILFLIGIIGILYIIRNVLIH